MIITSATFAADRQYVNSFHDGSTLNCVASSNIGNDGKGYTEKKINVIYQIDKGFTEPQAYSKDIVIIGNYRYDMSCSTDTCELSIRDQRTNVISTMNAGFSPMNQNKAQIEISNFNENLTLNISCQLIPAQK
jgi:hypothetical protein